MKKIEFKNLIKYWQITLVIFISLVFFVCTSSFNYTIQKNDFVKWGSPDETANYIFTKLYAQTGQISVFEKYNLAVDDVIRPRSFRSDFGEMKPMSFLGIIIIYGKIAHLTSYKVIPYLTPFFATLGLIFYYLLIKKMFGAKNALISFLLLACFPVYTYYSARSMFHNLLFVSLLTIGLYFAVSMIGKSENKYRNILYFISACLGGLFIGLSIITRSSELLWLGPSLFMVWIFNIRKVGISKLLLFLAFLGLGLLPALHFNQILYGNFYYGGYPEMNQSITNIATASTDLIKSTSHGQLTFVKDLILKIKDNVFHFGFNPDGSIKFFYYYFTKMFFWIFWPAIFGLILFIQSINKWKSRHYAYFSFFVITTIVLVLYYGSWEFHDNPDPRSFTIGNSYTRYWLPIYMCAIPLASLFILRLTKALIPEVKIKNEVIDILEKKSRITKFFKRYFSAPRKTLLVGLLRIIIIFTIMTLSINFVLFGSEEGVVYAVYKNISNRHEYNEVLNLTEKESVIITTYHDKLFFPERKVIVGLFDDPNMNLRYRRLAMILPVYYYNFTFPEKAIGYLNNGKLKDVGLEIKPIKKTTSAFTLYKLIPR